MKKYNITVNGTMYEVEVEELGGVVMPSSASAPRVEKPKAVQKPKSNDTSGVVKAPMPGTILSVDVKVGDTLKAGANLCILEAMKMENEIVAPTDCTVKEIHIQKGDTVANGDLLITLE